MKLLIALLLTLPAISFASEFDNKLNQYSDKKTFTDITIEGLPIARTNAQSLCEFLGYPILLNEVGDVIQDNVPIPYIDFYGSPGKWSVSKNDGQYTCYDVNNQRVCNLSVHKAITCARK